MQTSAATQRRIEISQERKRFCLANKHLKERTMAKILGISERQVRRYLHNDPYPPYQRMKKRIAAQKRLRKQGYSLAV